LMEGNWKFFYTTGQLEMEGSYRQNLQHGQWFFLSL